MMQNSLAQEEDSGQEVKSSSSGDHSATIFLFAITGKPFMSYFFSCKVKSSAFQQFIWNFHF